MTDAGRRLTRLLWPATALLLLAACSGSSPQWSGWAEPAEPQLPDPAHAPEWPPPPGSLRYLDVRGEPGPVLDTDDGLMVPTGFGLRWIPGDRTAESFDLPTPGWSRAVVGPAPGVYWVADGSSGLTLVRRSDDTLTWYRTDRIGTVTHVAEVDGRVLATVEEGLLLLLEPDEEGLPVEAGRLVLDGRPARVAVQEVGGSQEWAVATSEGGVVTGSLRPSGRLRADGGSRRRWARTVAVAGGGFIAGSSSPTLWGPGLGDDRTLGRSPSGLASDGGGGLWIAAGADGLLRLSPGGDQPDVVRQRPERRALAVSPARGGDEVWVSWSDGLIERTGSGGDVTGSHPAGEEGRITLADDGFRVHRLGRDRSRIVVPGGERSFDIGADVYDLEAGPDQALIAAQAEGTLVLRSEHGRWAIQPLRRGYAAGVTRTPDDGSIWIADEVEGLIHLDPRGSEAVHPTWGGAAVIAVDASRDRVAVVDVFTSDLLAVPRDGGAPVRAIVSGQARDVVLLGDRAVVGLARFGLGVVALDEGDWPEAQLIRLPQPSGATLHGSRLCPRPGGVLVVLEENGVAVVDVPESGPPRLVRIIETPGKAVHCSPGEEEGVFVISDSVALLELEISP